MAGQRSAKKNPWKEVKLGKGRERRNMHAAQSKARQITAVKGRVSETRQDKEEHGSCGKQGMTRQGKGHPSRAAQGKAG